MTLKAATEHPHEVRKHFHDYADVLDIYSRGQVASLRWSGSKREKEIRAKVYSEIAEEIRSIVFEAAP